MVCVPVKARPVVSTSGTISVAAMVVPPVYSIFTLAREILEKHKPYSCVLPARWEKN